MLPESRMLIIDLTAQTYREELISEDVMSDYLGGRGLGAYLLYRNIASGVDPLSPDNPLIFTVGFAQGTDTPFSPKVVLTTKSPLTNAYLYSISSGSLGHSIRRAGYMGVMIRGEASKPVYLRIRKGAVEFCDARHLWGMMTLASQEAMLREAGDPKASTAAIGPAGETLVRFAAVMNDGDTFRAFGRGGAGCVMGAKNLKGLIVSGNGVIAPHDPEKMKEIKRKVRDGLKENRTWAEMRRAFGTGEDMPEMNHRGMLPTHNWQTGVWEFAKLARIAPILNKGSWPRKNIPCGPHCPNPCSHHVRINKGPYKGASCDGPEYETMYAFGSNCGVDKFDAVVAAAEICDEYGLDTISTGLTISFLMECFTSGLINIYHTDGLDLQFGNDKALVAAVKKIAERDGEGRLWGEGVLRLSATIPGTSAFAMQCKGLEMGGYECRGFYGQAVEFAVNPKGGDHHGMGLPARIEAVDGTHRRIRGKGELLKKEAIGRIIADSLALCVFPRNIMAPLFPELIETLTGMEFGTGRMEEIGLRIVTLERLFNTREGLRRRDDTLPARLLEEPLPDGPNKGSVVPLEALKDEVYAALGWDRETGIPEDGLLRKLHIIP